MIREPSAKVVAAVSSAALILLIVAAYVWAAAEPRIDASRIVATERSGVEVCYPARHWSAHPEDRPCYTVLRPYEDGSGRMYLGTIGADAAVCVIPNVFEERGRFPIRCHRLAGRHR